MGKTPEQQDALIAQMNRLGILVDSMRSIRLTSRVFCVFGMSHIF